jgi:hypothetical protein
MTDSQQQDKNVFEQEARTFRVDLNQFLIESSKKGINMPAILTVLIEGVEITEAILRYVRSTLKVLSLSI